MKARVFSAMLFLVFGILGMTISSANVYAPNGGSFPGNALAFGIFSVFLAIIGIVLLVSWMFSELAGPSIRRMEAPAPAQPESMPAGETAE